MTLFFAGLAVILAAGVATVVVPNTRVRERIFVVGTLAGTLLGVSPAVAVLAGGEPIVTRWRSAGPGGDWVAGMDGLSAVFVIIVLAVGVACTSYGVAYMREAATGRARQVHFAGSALVASIALVVTAQSVVLFLCAWELMAIASFALILTDHADAEVRRAGVLYLVLTHTATLALFVTFALWTQHAADWTFASLAAAGVPAGARGFVLLACALAGFGIKAGLVPAHFWLPPAHAAAPPHVSAIMSGLVIKTGIYGLLRVAVLAGLLPAWWGWALLVIGGVSALLGVLWALTQHDLKRLLAYHSVENVGIIAMGLGLGALGTAHGRPLLAILGYASALLHTANHATFKALLFLSAGSVQRATHTRNIEAMGGLARRMPYTWATFAIGAAAITGLPPLNGFVSEWLLFLGLFRSATSGDATRMAVLGAALLAAVGGLALACFAKAAGIAFLGAPRSSGARAAVERAAGFLVPAMALAAVCVVIGVFAWLVVPGVLGVAAGIAGIAGAAPDAPDATAQALASIGAGALGVSAFAVAIIGTTALLLLARRRLLARASVRAEATWAGGWPGTTPRMQYTASSFAQPLMRAVGPLTGVSEHRGATVFHSTARDPVFDATIVPAWRAVQDWAVRIRPIQHGRLNLYLVYVVATLVALLAWAATAAQTVP